MGCTINSAKRRPAGCISACLKNSSRRGNEAEGCARLPGNPPRHLGGYGAWGFFRQALSLTAVLLAVVFQSRAGIPPAEELLPQDTLFMVTVPDFGKIREIFQASPQIQLWNSPAMRPFKEKFLTRWSEEFIKPLERELDVHFDDYASLPQGQLTFAVTQNGAGEQEDQPLGKLLLLDTRDKSDQLKTNLFELRKKWVDAGKLLR